MLVYFRDFPHNKARAKLFPVFLNKIDFFTFKGRFLRFAVSVPFSKQVCIRMVYIIEENRTEKLNETSWKKDTNCIFGLFL